MTEADFTVDDDGLPNIGERAEILRAAAATALVLASEFGGQPQYKARSLRLANIAIECASELLDRGIR